MHRQMTRRMAIPSCSSYRVSFKLWRSDLYQVKVLKMADSHFKPVIALMLLAALLVGQAQAKPKKPAVDKPDSSQVKKKADKAKASKVTFSRGSEESPAERSARLRRECAGAVNAGACAGYTR